MNPDVYNIIFMGTPDFSVPTLESLIASEHKVVAVVSQPDKKKGRGKKLAAPPVKVIAEKYNIPIHQPSKIKTDEFYSTLNNYNPDLIVVVAYGRILPPSILNLPRLGCINVHGSLLPRHRGAAPIQWAVIEGDEQVGVTIMQMDEGMDTGDILLPASIKVDQTETAGSLFLRLSTLGAETLLDALNRLQKGELSPVQQNHDKATHAPPLKKEMGLIDWSKPAKELQCLIRGLDPWPCGYTYLDGKRYRLFSPEVVHKKGASPHGTILLANSEGLLVSTGEASLLMKELQPEGRKRMSTEAFLCGHSIENGSQFTNS